MQRELVICAAVWTAVALCAGAARPADPPIVTVVTAGERYTYSTPDTVKPPDPIPPQPPDPIGIIFRDSFEIGGTAWQYNKGTSTYPNTGCRTGSCGAKTLAAGVGQQSVYWGKDFIHAGDTLYASGWWRFPAGFSWNPAPGETSYNDKLMIFNTADSVGRMHIVLTGSGNSPTFFITAERTDPKPPGVVKYTDVHWPPDGQWHHVEFEARRAAGTNGRMRVWLDNKLAVDETGRVCGTPCSPITGMQMGAYLNQGSATAQTFYMDDILISGTSPRPEPPARSLPQRLLDLVPGLGTP